MAKARHDNRNTSCVFISVNTMRMKANLTPSETAKIDVIAEKNFP